MAVTEVKVTLTMVSHLQCCVYFSDVCSTMKCTRTENPLFLVLVWQRNCCCSPNEQAVAKVCVCMCVCVCRSDSSRVLVKHRNLLCTWGTFSCKLLNTWHEFDTLCCRLVSLLYTLIHTAIFSSKTLRFCSIVHCIKCNGHIDFIGSS